MWRCHLKLSLILGGLLVITQGKDSDTLLGHWKLVSLDIEQKKSSSANEKNGDFIRAAITKDKITLSYGLNGNRNTEDLTYRLDDSKNPKWIDLIQADQTIQGIYTVSNDSLMVCLKAQGRPKEFASPKGSQQVLAAFKRDKR